MPGVKAERINPKERTEAIIARATLAVVDAKARANEAKDAPPETVH